MVPLDGEALARLVDPSVRWGRSPLVKAAETRIAVRRFPRAFRVRLCAVPRQRGRSSAVRATAAAKAAHSGAPEAARQRRMRVRPPLPSVCLRARDRYPQGRNPA
jgi:hypothetical protein